MLIRRSVWVWIVLPCLGTAAEARADWSRELESPRVQRYALSLSRRSLAYFLTNGREMRVPSDVPAVLKRRAGVIVTLEKRGQIAPRGCRGTTEPMRESLAREIICNTIAAATRDTRVSPLRKDELSSCKLSLSVIMKVTPIQSLSQHDAQSCGLMARSGERVGLVLPFEGREAATQWKWARQKAGLKDGERAQMLEVHAVRFRD